MEILILNLGYLNLTHFLVEMEAVSYSKETDSQLSLFCNNFLFGDLYFVSFVFPPCDEMFSSLLWHSSLILFLPKLKLFDIEAVMSSLLVFGHTV